MSVEARFQAATFLLTVLQFVFQLRIREGKAFLILPTGEEKAIDCIRGGRVVLGTGGLLLTIITPLQDDKRGGPDGVRIVDVVRQRMAEEPRREVPARRAAQRGGRQGRHAAVHQQEGQPGGQDRDAPLQDPRGLPGRRATPPPRWPPFAISSDICNSRHNDVGALELHEMSDPRASCTKGGFKVLLSSEFKAPTLKKGARRQQQQQQQSTPSTPSSW